MEEVRKRAKPSHKSDEENGDMGPAPRKVGRPSKPNKVVKLPSGRGRGRPPKNPSAASVKKTVDEEVGTNSVANGGAEVDPPKRGRPIKKDKKKVSAPIVATGRGRGRPKLAAKAESDEDEDDLENNAKTQTKSRKSGRPKKVVGSSDGDDSGSDEEKGNLQSRPIGRPSTGNSNLNIQRTGRGQGRPKKQEASNGGTKKRGRPSKSGDDGSFNTSGEAEVEEPSAELESSVSNGAEESYESVEED